MRVGNIEGQIDSLMQICYDSGELAAAVTSLTISGISGDVDEEYQLIYRIIDGADSAYKLYPNNDTTAANHGTQHIRGINTTASAIRDTAECRYGDGSSGQISMGVINFHATSGYVRTAKTKYITSVSGTTVTGIYLVGNVWNNTADNLTSFVFNFGTNGAGIGSRVILLRKVTNSGLKTGVLDVQGKVKYAWQEIYRNELVSAATSVTISGLTGNTDVLYRIKTKQIGISGGSSINVRPNNDSGSNYGYQYLNGTATAGAARGTDGSLNRFGNGADAGHIGMAEGLLYAKSGFVRTAIVTESYDVDGTTIGGLLYWGDSWNNTTDEITSLVFYSATNGMAIGTEIVLERLNL
jgi:hypothetical protein